MILSVILHRLFSFTKRGILLNKISKSTSVQRNQWLMDIEMIPS